MRRAEREGSEEVKREGSRQRLAAVHVAARALRSVFTGFTDGHKGARGEDRVHTLGEFKCVKALGRKGKHVGAWRGGVG